MLFVSAEADVLVSVDPSDPYSDGGHEFGRHGGKNQASREARRRRMPSFVDGLARLILFGIITNI